MLTAVPRRSVSLLVAVAAVMAVAFGVLTAPAFAQDDEETDDEGGTESLREQLDEAATAYQDAKAELNESAKRELKLAAKLETLDDELEKLVEEVQLVAATAYRTGRAGAISVLLSSGSPDNFLDRVIAVDMLAQREQEMLARLHELTESAQRQREAIKEEVAKQEDVLAKLEAAKKKAADALYAVGGGSTGQFVAYESPEAKPAPRNEDGSWPVESCSVNDPTTGACLTPRMLHAYNEAQLFGFDRHTSCYRSGSWGEHPQGRACDFSASVSGFGGAATGTDKTYGDKLASFFVFNADAFGVKYVIWYREIWFPGNGWRAYSGYGDPSSEHTNHVHVSIR